LSAFPNQFGFSLPDFMYSAGEPPGNLRRNGLYPVPIPVQKIAWRNLQAADLNRFSKIDNVSIGVRNAHSAGETLKTISLQRGDVAHAPIGDVCHTTKSSADFGVNLPHERARSRRMVDVGKHYYLGGWGFRNVIPPVHSLVVAKVGYGRRGRPYTSRHGIAGHGRKFGKQTPDCILNVTLVPHSHVECLNGIRNGTRVRLLQQGHDFLRDGDEIFHVYG
jgi:hypothetical protein